MKLVKFLTDEDGMTHPSKDWHYVHITGGSDSALCTGEVFGYGEGAATYRAKDVARGGITCPDCLAIIKKIKDIKL
jgi:hypothetical protein